MISHHKGVPPHILIHNLVCPMPSNPRWLIWPFPLILLVHEGVSNLILQTWSDDVTNLALGRRQHNKTKNNTMVQNATMPQMMHNASKDAKCYLQWCTMMWQCPGTMHNMQHTITSDLMPLPMPWECTKPWYIPLADANHQSVRLCRMALTM